MAETHLPCPCGKSSDAYTIYPNGGKCFSCGKFFNTVNQEVSELDVLTDYHYEYIARRSISKETHEFFKAITKVDDTTGKPVSVVYPYKLGKKIRSLDQKKFYCEGDMSTPGGWGPEYFAAGSAKAVTVVEGEDDMMAVYEMMGKYPVYSIKGASSAVRDVRADYEWLNSFEKIYLCLDNDAPGQKAANEIANIFGFQKVYHVKLAPLKDACEYNEQGKRAEFRAIWYNADRYLPDGIVSSFKQISDVYYSTTKHPRWATPFSTLNWMLGGGLEIHRAYLVSGLTGIGKTEFFRAFQHKLFKDSPDDNIGILHFEEPIKETIQRAVGYELKTPVHLDETHVPDEKVLETFQTLVGREDRVHFVQHYGSEEPDVVLAKIRFLVAACNCKYIFLDNITVLGTGRVQEDERKELDYLSTQLEMLVKELPFVLVFISHENEMEGTRGSANINKVVDVWINLKRDVENENEYARSILHFLLKKNRQASRTGPAGKARYELETSTLTELTEELPT